MTTREKLPPWRETETTEFRHGGMDFTLSAGCFADGRVAEFFLVAGKAGSAIEAMARDAGILASLALQYGAELQTMKEAMTREADGSPASPIGVAVDLIAAGPGGADKGGEA